MDLGSRVGWLGFRSLGEFKTYEQELERWDRIAGSLKLPGSPRAFGEGTFAGGAAWLVIRLFSRQLGHPAGHMFTGAGCLECRPWQSRA